MKVPAELLAGEGSVPALQMASSVCCHIAVPLCMERERERERERE